MPSRLSLRNRLGKRPDCGQPWRTPRCTSRQITKMAVVVTAPSVPFEVSSLLHSGYGHPTLREWQATAASSGGRITAASLVFPVFIHDKPNDKTAIPTLPGQFRYGVNTLKEAFEPLVAKGLATVLLFGVLSTEDGKDNRGSMADDPNGPVIQAIQVFRREFPSVLVACDLCLCAYTNHGHCGLLRGDGIDNQPSIERIAQVALNYVKAGCQLIAPSDMMDGRIRAIKHSLMTNGYGSKVPVMSYSAKFASVFYGPFRDAACSAPSSGDRKAYQLPPGARGLARRALLRDAAEGADMLMVKPGYPYLDIVRDAKTLVPDLPLAIYQVSGEYAMICHAATNKVFELRAGVTESLESAMRAGKSRCGSVGRMPALRGGMAETDWLVRADTQEPTFSSRTLRRGCWTGCRKTRCPRRVSESQHTLVCGICPRPTNTHAHSVHPSIHPSPL
ncbi:hypothetical protein BC831DRAFT_458126 [Entophlyctis helioformis]|nr:hypothetical protein BC831DRAFT_458126 [Entophlyctis helioformis]